MQEEAEHARDSEEFCCWRPGEGVALPSVGTRQGFIAEPANNVQGELRALAQSERVYYLLHLSEPEAGTRSPGKEYC